jgi:hypothetical protein
MNLLEVAQAVTINAETWQRTGDMDSFYVLIASLLLAFVAFFILMRWRS